MVSLATENWTTWAAAWATTGEMTDWDMVSLEPVVTGKLERQVGCCAFHLYFIDEEGALDHFPLSCRRMTCGHCGIRKVREDLVKIDSVMRGYEAVWVRKFQYDKQEMTRYRQRANRANTNTMHLKREDGEILYVATSDIFGSVGSSPVRPEDAMEMVRQGMRLPGYAGLRHSGAWWGQESTKDPREVVWVGRVLPGVFRGIWERLEGEFREKWGYWVDAGEVIGEMEARMWLVNRLKEEIANGKAD